VDGYQQLEQPERWSAADLAIFPGVWTHSSRRLLLSIAGLTLALVVAAAHAGRYLAFNHEVVSFRHAQGVPKAWISRRVGGDQIDYADETPMVRKMFADELAKNDVFLYAFDLFRT
jgi:hypothetical protein